VAGLANPTFAGSLWARVHDGVPKNAVARLSMQERKKLDSGLRRKDEQ
jgi:hypothetical protein